MMSALGKFLSPYFITPAFLGFLGLIPIVILLYLLKLRRTQVVIASTMLWIRSLQDLTANAPFQRLRKNLLMFLQILIIALIALALGRPFLKAEGTAGANLCVMIDRSGSMQAIEAGGKTRLDLAKGKALGLVEQMAGGDKMMVVAFGETTDVLCELTEDRYRLRAAIESIEPTDSRTKVRDALMVAHSLSLSVTDLRPVIISDGDIADLDEIGTRDIQPDFLQVGSTRDNAGIVAFSDREPLEGVGDRQTFILVHNESAAPLETTLSLYFNDELLSVQEVNAPAQSSVELVFAHSPLGEGVLRAELDHEDALAVDNAAWLAMRPPAKLKALLVTESDSISGYYLKRVLALESRVTLDAVAPGAYTAVNDYDIIIFDNFAPSALPPGTLLFLNALPPIEGLEAEGVIERPPILAKQGDHPMMRFLNPATVGIAKAQRVSLPPGARSLLSTEGGPLIADVSRGGQQILVVAFDIAESNWPMHLSFPLFVQNLLAWAPEGALSAEQSELVGRPLGILAAANAESAVVTRPDGKTETIALNPLLPTFYGRTDRAGVYSVTMGEMTEPYAVNLLDRNESAIAPAESLAFGRVEIAAERETIKQNRELWWWFLLAAVAVLGAEWWIYSRRAWA